jgi:hypothetical protein
MALLATAKIFWSRFSTACEISLPPAAAPAVDCSAVAIAPFDAPGQELQEAPLRGGFPRGAEEHQHLGAQSDPDQERLRCFLEAVEVE